MMRYVDGMLAVEIPARGGRPVAFGDKIISEVTRADVETLKSAWIARKRIRRLRLSVRSDASRPDQPGERPIAQRAEPGAAGGGSQPEPPSIGLKRGLAWLMARRSSVETSPRMSASFFADVQRFS